MRMSKLTLLGQRAPAALGAAAALALSGLLVLVSQASATHQPADKVKVAASVLEVMQAQAAAGSGSSGPVELLHDTFRSSTPADLLIGVTAECGLWTQTVVSDSESEQADAAVTMWVELDGQVLPVTFDSNGDGVYDDPDDGRVAFCNREQELETTNLGDPEVIDLFLRTREANGFNWAALDVGNGIHELKVFAQLDVEVQGTGSGSALAVVGKRTVQIQPDHFKNDETF
jgi:hypothetical protein